MLKARAKRRLEGGTETETERGAGSGVRGKTRGKGIRKRSEWCVWIQKGSAEGNELSVVFIN